MDSVKPTAAEQDYRRPLAESAWRLAVVLVAGGFVFVVSAVFFGVLNGAVLKMPGPTTVFLSLGIGGFNAYFAARGALQYIDRPVRDPAKKP